MPQFTWRSGPLLPNSKRDLAVNEPLTETCFHTMCYLPSILVSLQFSWVAASTNFQLSDS